MKIQNQVNPMKLCNLIFFTLVGVCVGGMIYGIVSHRKITTTCFRGEE